MYAKNALEKQRKFVEEEGTCKCLIHHPTDPKRIAQAVEMLRSGDAAQSAIAAQMLSGCPTRKEK